jgi:mono/diheme cytochrome c family protein
MFLISRLVFSGVALLLGVGAIASQARADLTIALSVSGPEQVLKTWDAAALANLKTSASSQEKDPLTGKLTTFKGLLLSHLVEQSMAGVALERKAQVDLLVIKNGAGGQVLLPRSVLTKYPAMLALGGPAPRVVMPWTSKPKMLKEDLPIESYFVSDVVRIELANYRERYSSVYLKRRTDPLAMKGEKIFVQNCVGCHADGNRPALSELSGEPQARKLASDGHPPSVKGVPKLSERDRRALANYLNAYRAERASGIAAAEH